jgi:hypothetical protein
MFIFVLPAVLWPASQDGQLWEEQNGDHLFN